MVFERRGRRELSIKNAVARIIQIIGKKRETVMPVVTLNRIAIASATAFAVLAASSSGALAQKKYDTGATDFAPISQLQLEKFKGEKWELFGDIISGDVGG